MTSALANYDNEPLYNYITDPVVVRKMLFYLFSKQELIDTNPANKSNGKSESENKESEDSAIEQLTLLQVKEYVSDVISNKDFDDILDTIVNDKGLLLYVFSYLKKDDIISDEMDLAILYYYKQVLSAMVRCKYYDFLLELKNPNSHIVTNLLKLISNSFISQLITEIVNQDSEFLKFCPEVVSEAMKQLRDFVEENKESHVNTLGSFLINLLENNKISPSQFVETIGEKQLEFVCSSLLGKEYDLFLELVQVLFQKLLPTEEELMYGEKTSPDPPHPLLLNTLSHPSFLNQIKLTLTEASTSKVLGHKAYRCLQLLSSLLSSENSSLVDSLLQHDLFRLWFDSFFARTNHSMLHNLTFEAILRIFTKNNEEHCFNKVIEWMFLEYNFHEKIKTAFLKYYSTEQMDLVKKLICAHSEAGYMEHLLRIANKISDSLSFRITFPQQVVDLLSKPGVEWKVFAEQVLLPFNLMSTQSLGK